MLFTVSNQVQQPPVGEGPHFLLSEDKWNDWHEYWTLYDLWMVEKGGNQRHLGNLKIGQIGMPSGQARPAIHNQFESLDDKFFSLGQSEHYYESIKSLGDDLRIKVLSALRDIAFDLNEFERVKGEAVTQESLLRSVKESTVRGQFNRIACGGVKLTPYAFDYITTTKHKLVFEILPDLRPPTNIHVLIGTNGVGKTTLLKLIARALVERDQSPDEVGELQFRSIHASNVNRFANIVSVSFSIFDPFALISASKDNKATYSYIGVNELSEDGKLAKPKTRETLSVEFAESFIKCQQSKQHIDRWKNAFNALKSDPIFASSKIDQLIELTDENEEELKKRAGDIFSDLSSGHEIVLLTITKLVELAEECTLLLMDEPETHLHPPFLSSFIRALSDLLIDRNGAAIIATHSPVVLQEVPCSCVWKVRRIGENVNYERPTLETFGENVGILTHEVFRLEVTNSGFYKLLLANVDKHKDYQSVLWDFNDQLGMEARAIVRALLANRKSKGTAE